MPKITLCDVTQEKHELSSVSPLERERDGASMYIPVWIYHSCKAELVRLSSKTQLQAIGQYGRVYRTSGALIRANQHAMSLYLAEPAPVISAEPSVLQLVVPHMPLLSTSHHRCDCISTHLQSQSRVLWSHFGQRHKVSLDG